MLKIGLEEDVSILLMLGEEESLSGYSRAIQLVCHGGQFMKSIPNEGPERYGLQYE